jgi:23S rRNA pseudouridine1911/1915/1917 synthase
MGEKRQVKKESPLFLFLTTSFSTWSKNKLRDRLRSGCVFVNGVQVSKYDLPLHTGDAVEIQAQPKVQRVSRGQLEILFQDDALVAIHKPHGLLSVASANEPRQHALALLRRQLSQGRSRVSLWPVHRLDRETSGVLLFAKSRGVVDAIQKQWSEAKKTYLAVVEGHPRPASGSIDQPLRMDARGFRAHAGRHPEAVRALTHFRTIATVGENARLEIDIETGRQHQIRAHLGWLGHPVLGDARYGASVRVVRRLALHAWRLEIPETDASKAMLFVAEPPPDL